MNASSSSAPTPTPSSGTSGRASNPRRQQSDAHLPRSCAAARQALSAHLDAPLPASQQAAVAQHLAYCADCRAWQAALQRGHQRLATLPRISLGADVRRTVLAAASQRRTRPRIGAPAVGVVLLAVLLIATGVFAAALRNGGSGGAGTGADGGTQRVGGGDVALASPTLDPMTTLQPVETIEGDQEPFTCWEDPALFALPDAEDPNLVQIWFLQRLTSNDCPAPERATLTLGDADGTEIPLAVDGNPVELPMDGNPLGVIGHATWANWCGESAVQVGLDLEANGQGLGIGTTLEPPPCTDPAAISTLVADPDPFATPWPLSGVGIGTLLACDATSLNPAVTHEPGDVNGSVRISLDPNLNGDRSNDDAPCLLPATEVTITLLDADGLPLVVDRNATTVVIGGVRATVIPGSEPLHWIWSNWCSDATKSAVARVSIGGTTTDIAVPLPGCVDDAQSSALTSVFEIPPPDTDAMSEEPLTTCDLSVLSPSSRWGGGPHPDVKTIQGSGTSFSFNAFGGSGPPDPWSTPTPEPDSCVIPTFQVEVVLTDVYGTPLDVSGNGSTIVIGGAEAGEFPRKLVLEELVAGWTWSNWCGDTPEGILVFMQYPAPRPDVYGAAMPAPECVDPSQPSVLQPDPGSQTGPDVDLATWQAPTLSCEPTDDPDALATFAIPENPEPIATVWQGTVTYQPTPSPPDPHVCTWTYGTESGTFFSNGPQPTPSTQE